MPPFCSATAPALSEKPVTAAPRSRDEPMNAAGAGRERQGRGQDRILVGAYEGTAGGGRSRSDLAR